MPYVAENNQTAWRTQRFRLLGILPLLFFLARFIEYVKVGTPSHILWSCHISNLMLAVGLFTAQPLLIRTAAFWLLLGLPPWVIDMYVIRIVTPVSLFSHLGGAVTAVYALRRVGAVWWSWVPALLWFLFLQQLCRFVTPADLNVNVAHYAYGPWRDLFAVYWKYWLANTALAAATLVVIELGLVKLFPQRGGGREA